MFKALQKRYKSVEKALKKGGAIIGLRLLIG